MPYGVEKIAALALKEAPNAVKLAEEAARDLVSPGGSRLISDAIGSAKTAGLLSTGITERVAAPYIHRTLSGEQEILQQLEGLQSKYRLKIPDANKEVANPFAEPGTETLVTRLPSLGELKGLKAAFKHSEPSHLVDRDSVTMHFYKASPEGLATRTREIAHYSGHNIYFVPEQIERLKPLAALPELSVKSVGMHELAHNGQKGYRFQHILADHSIADKLGWAPRPGGQIEYVMGAEKWMFRTKTLGPYTHFDSNSQQVPLWRFSSDHSNAVSVDLSSAEVRKNAVVPPISNYFPNPSEMITEGTVHFRYNETTRLNLLRESPILYRLVKQLDDVEILRVLGVNKLEQPKFIRTPQGFLEKNNDENKRLVEAFEKGGK